ncbi:MAG: hypothetical protein ACYCZR_11945 [Burkholderiales bacterium]
MRMIFALSLENRILLRLPDKGERIAQRPEAEHRPAAAETGSNLRFSAIAD